MQLIKKLEKVHYAILFILLALVSFSTLNSDFIFIDDAFLIVNNPHLNFSLPNLVAIMSKPLGQVFDAADYPIQFIYYRPALSLYYMFNDFIWGTNPVGFHIANLLLHLCTTILIYRIGLLLFDSNKGLSLFAAALFCVHPVHNELIGRVAMNENLLGVLMAAAFYFYLKGRKSLSLAAFAIALLTKESAIMLPFVLFVFELRKQKVRDAARYMAPYAALMTVYLVLRTAVVGFPEAFSPNENLPEALLSVFVALATYFRLLFLPYSLNVYYPTWKFISPFQGDLLLAVPICLLLGYALWRLKNDKLTAPLLLGVVVLLAPVVLKANEMILGSDRAFIAEHQLYVPAILFSLFISALIYKGNQLQQSKYLLTAFICVIPLFVYLANTVSVVWASSDVLNAQFIKDYPNSSVAYRILGNNLLEKGDTAGALAALKKALPAAKENAIAKHANASGNTSAKKSRTMADLLDKYNIAAYQPEYAEIHYQIARVYIAKNDLDEALKKFKTVLVLQPHFIEARISVARIYMEKCQFADASREYKLALKDIETFRRH